MKQILEALKDVFLSFFPSRSLIESMMKYDFKIGDSKTQMMQLCFSNLASWPLIFILLLINFDPFRYSWSLVKLLSYDNTFMLFLLDGRILNMLVIFLVFIALEWLLKKEYILIALVFYFLGRSELHIHLAVAAVLAIYVARISYLWRLSLACASETKKIWKAVSILQFAAWLVTAVVILNALDFIQINHLFNEDSDLTRFNFLCLAVLIYHIFNHLFLSLWGHFYVQKKIDPAYLPVYFSTSQWLSKVKFRGSFLSIINAKITEQLSKHQQNQVELEELKKINPKINQAALEQILKREVTYLNEAQQRLH